MSVNRAPIQIEADDEEPQEVVEDLTRRRPSIPEKYRYLSPMLISWLTPRLSDLFGKEAQFIASL